MTLPTLREDAIFEPAELVRPDRKEELRRQLFDVMLYYGDRTREICVTRYEGNYGSPAGHVIAINGSPPKGTLFVPADWHQPAFLYQGGRMSRIDPDRHAARYEVIQAYLKAEGHK